MAVGPPPLGSSGGRRYKGQEHAVGLGGCEIEVKRTLTLTFGHFGWSSLAAEARRERASLEELICGAAAYLHSKLRAGRSVLPVPLAARQPHGRGSRLELALPPAMWRELGEEAGRQRVGLGRLLEHAALYYLAAVDSGREAARLTAADGHRGARSTLKLTGRRPGAACPTRR
jgi:hypothetical protein